LNDDDIPEAKARKHRMFAWVWIVPITAAIIVIWLAVRSFAVRGPDITITFRNAEGLQPKQSVIQHRGVQVGTVEQLQFTKDMSGVIVRARMRRAVDDVLTGDAKFYIVAPHVGVEGITGLSTLVSGSYIEMLPGKAGGKPTHAFQGLNEPPVLDADSAGRAFTMTAADLGSLTRGSPISYHGVSVGEVERYAISDDGQRVNVTAFIRSPWDRFIHPETRFWNAGGVDVSAGAQGVRIRANSWQQLLSGGIAFETPTEALNGTPSAAGSTFALYDNRRAAFRDPRGEQLLYVADFTGNLRGLDEGTAVELEGVEIGAVRDTRLSYDAKKRTLSTLVTIAVDPDSIHIENLPRPAGTSSSQAAQQWIETLVAGGLRAQVTTANLLTGFKIVALDMVPGAPPARVEKVGAFVRLPTSSAGDLNDVLNSLRGVLKNIDAATSGPELGHAIQSLDRTMTHLDHLTADVQPDLKELIKSLRQTSEAAQGALTAVQGLVGQGGGADAGGPDLQLMMKQLTEAARSVRSLADYLDRHPEALLRGRKE
jgi:paraquat-inducible protein B